MIIPNKKNINISNDNLQHPLPTTTPRSIPVMIETIVSIPLSQSSPIVTQNQTIKIMTKPNIHIRLMNSFSRTWSLYPAINPPTITNVRNDRYGRSDSSYVSSSMILYPFLHNNPSAKKNMYRQMFCHSHRCEKRASIVFFVLIFISIYFFIQKSILTYLCSWFSILQNLQNFHFWIQL